MGAYEYDDIITIYIIARETDRGDSYIKAWSTDKNLVSVYMEFHKCPKFRVIKITEKVSNLKNIIDGEYHNEIVISNIYTRSSKNKHKSELVAIPTTEAEMAVINAEANDFFASRIRYDFIEQALQHLKRKHRDALRDIFLTSVIAKTIHNRSNEYTENVTMDQVKILYESFPDQFG